MVRPGDRGWAVMAHDGPGAHRAKDSAVTSVSGMGEGMGAKKIVSGEEDQMTAPSLVMLATGLAVGQPGCRLGLGDVVAGLG